MKVIENAPESLILDDRPWFRGILITAVTLYVVFMGFHEWNDGRPAGPYIAVFGALIGGIFFALFVQRSQIIFDRNNATILKRTKSIWGYKETETDLNLVTHAEIRESKDSDGGTMYQPVLKLKGQEDLELVAYSTTGFGPPKVVDTVNTWLGVLDTHTPSS